MSMLLTRFFIRVGGDHKTIQWNLKMTNVQPKPQPFLLLGSTSEGKAVTLTGSDFKQHKVISGITGSGKSTFLAWIALSLLRQAVAFTLIDPHGDLCRLIL